METYDIRGTINYKVFKDVLVESIGLNYRLDMESLSGGMDFTVSSGVIENVWEENDTLFLDRTDKFTLPRIKHIGQRSGRDYESFKITFSDNSYFKIYIAKYEGVEL